MSEGAEKRWQDRAYECPGRPIEPVDTSSSIPEDEEGLKGSSQPEPENLNRGAHDYIRHDLVPISWLISPTSKHVSTLMCMKCFEMIDMSEAQNYSSTKK